MTSFFVLFFIFGGDAALFKLFKKFKKCVVTLRGSTVAHKLTKQIWKKCVFFCKKCKKYTFLCFFALFTKCAVVWFIDFGRCSFSEFSA